MNTTLLNKLEIFKCELNNELQNDILNYWIQNALDDLDPQVLYSTVLRPILGIDDPTEDKNLFHLPEIGNEIQIKNLVDSGAFHVGFGCLPVSVEQMKSVADQGLTMPPKSTYIEPKLRSALTIYELKQ